MDVTMDIGLRCRWHLAGTSIMLVCPLLLVSLVILKKEK